MFADIAPRYDFLNRVLSFGIDRSWRKKTVRSMALPKDGRLLDLCCGTGDLALDFSVAGVQVIGADFTAPMLPLAQAKAARAREEIVWAQADAQELPFQKNSFDGVSIAFGIRNVYDPERALSECFRVLRPGGQLAILEFFPMKNRVWKACFGFYFQQVLPRLARVFRAGRTGAYDYLPSSVAAFATTQVFTSWLEKAGFQRIKKTAFTGGVAHLFLAQALNDGD
jgi:demethylmenaquinone methyltransferase/2-methoxy-6-polyprenyl-1,4-benzoquinol methylase